VAPIRNISRKLVDYLPGLSVGMLILWCYFIWYLVVLVRYFDPRPRLWLTSLGLSLIIGTALLINTTASGRRRVTLEPWPTFRLFLTPFCVSSFAALVKDRQFVMIFSPRWDENLTALGLCAALCAAVMVLKRPKFPSTGTPGEGL
jgi:hypothetical protein